MIRGNFFPILSILILISLGADVEAQNNTFSGLVKLQAASDWFNSDSVYSNSGDSPQNSYQFDSRLIYQDKRDNWQWAIHYQLNARKSKIADNPGLTPTAIDDIDQHRYWNLTRSIKENDNIQSYHRIDRAYLRYSSEQWLIKLGRQAISWGHGLFFNPLDIANPFDPILVDKEYKAGDDMLYFQWLQQSGNDLQWIFIPRRDSTGKLESDQVTFAAKYRGLHQNIDYDILVARHYAENVVGVGGNIPWLESNINSDVLLTRENSQHAWVASANLGISYSWTWFEKNLFGRMEYFHNGFGLTGTDLTDTDVAQSPALLSRLSRGETFILEKNYIAAGLNIELHPLDTLDINLFFNLHDNSALLQLINQYSYRENSQLSAGLLLPLGADGSEYGGIATGTDQYLSRKLNIWAKYSRYF